MPTADDQIQASVTEPVPEGRVEDPRDPRPRRRRRLLASVVVLVLVAAASTVWYVVHRATAPILGTGCTAVANGRTVNLDADQASNAAIIAAVAVRRKLPARAATIAIATALQESKLHNLTYGDRDSLGLFQQRPSQGWGTKAQVTDPVYATNAFYDVLVKIEGYRTLPVTKAAQKVQRSAFPSAYAAHEEDARVLASALTGYSAGAFTCVLAAPAGKSERPDASGLTPQAEVLAHAAERELGATVAASGAKGTSLELRLPASSSATSGWAIAQWAVARSGPLQVVAVGTAGRSWSRSDNPNRWAGQSVAQLSPGHVIVQVA
jgi:hypothetical protein